MSLLFCSEQKNGVLKNNIKTLTILLIIYHHTFSFDRNRLLWNFPQRNKVITLSSACVMTSIFFRCLEAMYDTSPNVVELSIWNYCGYYGNVVGAYFI